MKYPTLKKNPSLSREKEKYAIFYYRKIKKKMLDIRIFTRYEKFTTCSNGKEF